MLEKCCKPLASLNSLILFLMHLPKYLKIKDNYCLCYFGFNKDHIRRLTYLRPHIEKAYPSVHLYVALNDKMRNSQDSKIIGQSDLTGDGRKKFGYIRELKGDGDLVVDFLKESHLCHLLDKI